MLVSLWHLHWRTYHQFLLHEHWYPYKRCCLLSWWALNCAGSLNSPCMRGAWTCDCFVFVGKTWRGQGIMSSWMQCNGNMMEWLTMRRGIIYYHCAYIWQPLMPGTANNAKATILSSFGWSLQKSRASLYRSVGSGYYRCMPRLSRF